MAMCSAGSPADHTHTRHKNVGRGDYTQEIEGERGGPEGRKNSQKELAPQNQLAGTKRERSEGEGES